jgi:hypothetical protein
LQTVFKNLMGVLVRPRWEQLDELCSAAGTVRKEGLAKIVRCSSDRIDDLAEAIVYGKYDIIGPPLGANRTQRQGEVIYVIPPMDPKFEDELDKAIRERHPQAKVMFSDTLTFGASVMRIRLHRYTEVAQLFEGMTAYDAKEAMEGELAPLLSVDQHAGFAHFNGRIEGDRVVFPNRQSVTH